MLVFIDTINSRVKLDGRKVSKEWRQRLRSGDTNPEGFPV